MVNIKRLNSMYISLFVLKRLSLIKALAKTIKFVYITF
jgi:hypothetical protein